MEGYTEDEVLDNNKKHLKCPKCGHEEDIRGACVISNSDGTFSIYFGSDADFCTKCDAPWGRNK